MEPLKDKSVVIVGGTTGLGYSAARACVTAGARVVLVGRNPENAKCAAASLGEGKAVAVAGDASDPATTPAAIDLALRQFNRFDALYHVAGGSGRKAGDGPLHEITDEGWDYTHRLNLTGLFYSNRAAVRQFLKQGTGGSVLGSSPSPQYFATHAYASAKSAVVGFTRAISAYYAQKDIRCNLIVPALVETPMSQRAAGDETILKFIATKQPLDGGRIGRPEDLDAAVVFFLSDASKFCTGAVLTIDGGWSVTEGQYDR